MNLGSSRLSLAELADACRTPWRAEPFSALLQHPFLLLDLDSDPAIDRIAIEPFIRFLVHAPCPTLGIARRGTQALPELVAALDVVAQDERELAPVVRNIAAHPVAAATLVQVLRHNARSSIDDALLAESLAYGNLQFGHDFRGFLSTLGPPALGEDADPVQLRRERNTLLITLNRPQRRNAYSVGMRDALYEALMLLASDPTLANAEIRGAGDCFCTGGDLSEFGLATDPAQAHLIRMSRSVPLLLAQLADRVEFHVHRACIGSGIELPAFAKRVVATEDTFFQLPEITMGLIPGAGGTVSIPRRIGRQRAANFALSARRINAKTGLAWGLIDHIA